MNIVSSSLPITPDRRRWLALVVVCMAQLMIVLDTHDRERGAALDPA